MKLKLTPELFILQDVISQIASHDEEKKEVIVEQAINRNADIDLEHKLKQINRKQPYIETPEFKLLNSRSTNVDSPKHTRTPHRSVNLDDHYFEQPLEPNIEIIQNNNGRLALDKRFVNKRRSKRSIIQSDIRCVILNKEKYGNSFGLTIRGGLESNKPFIISAIQRNSIADKCRSLFLGDLIVELNGQSTYPLRFTHEQAMKIVRSNGNRLYLTVKHLTMFNRPIARCWQRQINMTWLNGCDNKNEDWHTYSLNNSINHQQFALNNRSLNNQLSSSNKSSSQESNIHQSNTNPTDTLLLTDCEQYSNCGTVTLSNLTVTVDKDEQLFTPSPLNDEGVYTGLSNDALSSSECPSDASGFSSDYVNTNVCTNHHTQQRTINHTYQQHQSNSHNNCSSERIVNRNHAQINKNSSYINETNTDVRKINEQVTLSNHGPNESAVDGGYVLFRELTNENLSSTKNSNQEMISSCSSFDDSSSRNTSSANRTSLMDIVSVNLINCFFTKYIYNTDNTRRNGVEVRWLNMHNKSPIVPLVNRRSIDLNSAVISFNDLHLAHQFQQKINHYMTKLNESYMFNFNRGLSPQNRILYMGWISLAIPKSSKLNQQPPQTSNLQLSSSLDYNWSAKYLLIKGGEMLLYDTPPDYLLDKIQLDRDDTLLEFNELSDLLINKNGNLTCSITLNNDLNNKPKINTQSNRHQTRSSLTRHLSIRGRDYSINKSSIHQSDRPNFDRTTSSERYNEPRVLVENKRQQQKTSNRLICTLTRNLSLKSSKENRYKQRPNCTLPRNQIINQEMNKFSTDKQTARNRIPMNNNFVKQPIESTTVQQVEWKNEPTIFKAYESVLRQLRPDEQLDKRENCLLALTTKSDNAVSVSNEFKFNPLSTFERQLPSNNHSTGELDNNSNWHNIDSCSRKNSLDSNLNDSCDVDHNEQNSTSTSTGVVGGNQTMVAYLAVEHADNISQILKSWSVATMHSVIQLSKKSFYVMSEGKYCCLTLDWTTGSFTLYDCANVKWSFKFSQLKNSSDDGCKTLWLSFQSIKHQPVVHAQRPVNLALSSFSNINQSGSSLNSSVDSIDRYSQRNRACTPILFDSSNNLNSSNYLQTNRTEFRIKKSIETKEITCSNLQHLIYCMHSFLAAKVTNCVASMPVNGIFV